MEYVYCAVNKDNNIMEVSGSSKKTRYFRTAKYLKRAVEYHNRYYDNDSWRVAKFKLAEVAENE